MLSHVTAQNIEIIIFFQGKKCLPTDIRCKKTVRRALTEHETSIKSAKPLAKTRKYS